MKTSGFIDTLTLRPCKVLEDNYNIILEEYNNFTFDINKVDEIKNDENWQLWKSVHEDSYDMAEKEYGNDENMMNVSYEPYKEAHSWYGLIVEHKSVWDGVLLATKSKMNATPSLDLKPTPICNKFFNKTLECIKEFPEVTNVMVARLPAGALLPKHRGYRQIRRIHLGLVVPDGDVKFCVSDVEKKWETGKCLAFNDHCEHTAWNNTNQDRIALLVDVFVR